MPKTYYVGTPKDLSGDMEIQIAIPEETEEKDLPADDYYWKPVTVRNGEGFVQWIQAKREHFEAVRGPHDHTPEERIRVQKITDPLEAIMRSLEIETQDTP